MVTALQASANPLLTYFQEHTEGKGIWKWTHYFDIYHRYFQKFVGQEVHVVEVGVYAGGSLEMWRDYFGPRGHIYGVDINPTCSIHQSKRIKVFIGDQADTHFWQRIKTELPRIDIVIDDGGHDFNQQLVTFNSLIDYIHPGGVYLCEDLHGELNLFARHLHNIADGLNNSTGMSASPDNAHLITTAATQFQKNVSAMHFYTFVTVIEKNSRERPEYFEAQGRGSKW